MGLGAIGGSLAWQAVRAGVPRVIGYSPKPAESIAALKAEAVTEVADSVARAVAAARLVVLAVPPAATVGLLADVAARARPAATITDVASVKAPVLAQAERLGLGARFAGAHPLAGTHGSGFEAARPDLLRGCVVYVCASSAAGGDDAARGVMGFWEEVLDAHPVRIDAAAHDRQLAWTSHLPQAVASALAHALLREGLRGVSYGTGGCDTMRLALSNADLWTEVLVQNREPVAAALGGMAGAIDELAGLIRAGDAAGLRAFLADAAEFRRGIER